MARRQDQVRLWNLELLVQEAGSAASLARKVGTSESYLSQIRRQLPTRKGTRRGIGDDLADKLERGMDKPLGWMDEPHFALDEAPAAQRIHGPAEKVTAGIYRRHPVITWDQAARWEALTESFDSGDAEAWLPCPVPCSRYTFVLQVEGESMAPRFLPGELIFVDPEVPARPGAFVIARPAQAPGPVLRQLDTEAGQSYLRALNPDWPERISVVAADTRIIGTVIFKGETLG